MPTPLTPLSVQKRADGARALALCLYLSLVVMGVFLIMGRHCRAKYALHKPQVSDDICEF